MHAIVRRRMGKTERGIQTKVKQTPTATKNHFLTCWMTTGSTKTPTEAEHALGTRHFQPRDTKHIPSLQILFFTNVVRFSAPFPLRLNMYRAFVVIYSCTSSTVHCANKYTTVYTHNRVPHTQPCTHNRTSPAPPHPLPPPHYPPPASIAHVLLRIEITIRVFAYRVVGGVIPQRLHDRRVQLLRQWIAFNDEIKNVQRFLVQDQFILVQFLLVHGGDVFGGKRPQQQIDFQPTSLLAAIDQTFTIGRVFVNGRLPRCKTVVGKFVL